MGNSSPKYLRAFLAIFLSLVSAIICLRAPEFVLLVCTVTAAFGYFSAVRKHLFVGHGSTDTPAPPEPAFRQYFFKKSFDDLSLTVKEAWGGLSAASQKGVKWLEGDFPKIVEACFVGVIVIGGALTIGIAIPLVAFTAIHFLVVCALAGLFILLAVLFQAIETVNLLRRGIFIACPHGGCYRKIPLPIYQCPKCGAEHKRLVPGAYGVLRRRCECGNMLPTLFLFKRHDLPSFCPHCRRPLPGMEPVRAFHFPIIGGSSAGKSSFLMAALVELQDFRIPGFTIEPVGQRPKQSLEEVRRAYYSGQLLKKTSELTPDAFLARVVGPTPRLLYFYDAAGEVFQGSDALLEHQHLSYASSIFFLVDPFSLPAVQAALARECQQLGQLRPSEEEPAHVYARLVTAMRKIGGKERFTTTPIAVILTKTDANPIVALNSQWSRAAGPEERSAAIRRWLQDMGQSNLLILIEQDFGPVRYFSSSALGRLPERSSEPFRPRGVIDPVLWVLESNGVALRSMTAGRVTA